MDSRWGTAIIIVLLGALLAAYGVRKYLVNAKQQEARTALVTWANGLAGCGLRDKHLPPSSTPVPASLEDVRAKKWQSTPADWREQAFSCAGFSLSAPQYFQYHWQSRGPHLGVASAVADLDGDGVPEEALTVEVSCSDGSCAAGPLGGIADAASPQHAKQAEAEAANSGASPAEPRTWGVALLVAACLGAVWTFSAVWLTVTAFQVSVGWGIATLLVPCARLVFVVRYWQRAKRPFLLQVATFAVLTVGLFIAAVTGMLPTSPRTSASAATSSVALESPPGPPPLPSFVVPPMTGDAVDLSSVMGRARKLANAWQPEAALLGVEATLADGKIQAQDGASAKLTFGPSVFDTTGARSGLFVVIYDKSGINGAPVAGKPGMALPEPMCAPEHVLPRLTGAQGPIVLRYGRSSGERPLWIASPQERPKDVSLFDPQDCSAVALPRKQR